MSCTAWCAELNGVVCCAYHAMNSDLLNNLKVFNGMTCIAWCAQPSSVGGVQWITEHFKIVWWHGMLGMVCAAHQCGRLCM